MEPSLMGGVDGLVTSFAIVASSQYTSSPVKVATVVGFSSLVADGISMGISQYLSASSSEDRAQRREELSRPSPVLMGAACAASFVVVGSVPLVAFVLGDASMVAAVCSTLLMLFILGVMRVVPADARSVVVSVLRTCVLGAVAGGLAYVVAEFASDVVEDDEDDPSSCV